MIDVFSQLILKEMTLTLQQRKKHGRKESEESLHLEQTNSAMGNFLKRQVVSIPLTY